jgi:hypothetical protein
MTRAFALGCAVLLALAGPALAAPKAKKAEPKQEAPVCVLLAPLMDKLKASGLEHQVITDGIAVLRIAAVLQQNADKPFPMPTSLVIVFYGEHAYIGLVVNDKLCARVTGPASAVRAMLKAVHGQNVGHDI